MIEHVIKADGTKENFQPEKLNKWARHATKLGGNWSSIAIEVYKQLPKVISTKEIHQTMTNVCANKNDIVYSRVAARLEIARLRKNMERYIGVSDQDSIKNIFEAFINKGLWLKSVLPEYNPEWETWYEETKNCKKEYWELKQWGDKYSLKVDKEPVETPHIALMASALALHGDNLDAKEMYQRAVSGKLSLPTPALNGMRNGDFDTISCSLIEAKDTTDSILVAQYLAAKMTAKKAGVGIKLSTRSIKDSVRNGITEHLGKHSLYANVSSGVKMFTQITRGGSANIAVECIDPEIENILLWKSQRSAIDIRLDKIDYSMIYNDAFVEAIIAKGDWHLFSLKNAPNIYKQFFSKGTADEYNALVKEAISNGVPHKTVKALDIVKWFSIVRQETGRMYAMNASRVNKHTPYTTPIHQSNLCMEIVQPTAGFDSLEDLLSEESNGEISFCGLSAGNYSKIDITDDADIEATVRIGIRTITRMIEKVEMPHKSMKTSIMKRMNAGFGITGLADAIYNSGFDYVDDVSMYEFARDLAEKHTFYAYKASQELFTENAGKYNVPEGIDLNWLPIDTAYNIINKEFKMPWETLRGKPRVHSVLVCIQPSESSSVFSGGLNSVYPARMPWIGKSSRAGVVKQIFINFDEARHTGAYDVESRVMIKLYSVLTDVIDQSISSDYYFDPSKYENEKRPLSEAIREFVMQAKMGVKTMYYQNTKVESDNQTTVVEADCEDCSM